MENPKNKKSRSVNFRPSEIEILVQLVCDKKDIIENKTNNSATWQQKQKAWEEISENLTAATGVYRDTKVLKNKYELLKKALRKKCAEIRQEQLLTGGGPCIQNILTPVEEKIKGMISLSVEGLPSIWDSDSEIISIPTIPELSRTEVEGMSSTLIQESSSMSGDNNIKEELELGDIRIIPDDAKTSCTSPRHEQNKKSRSVNFTPFEIEMLVQLVCDKKDIIENKTNNSATWHEKQKAWEEISQNITAATGIYRDSKVLRSKYEVLKKKLRKKCAEIRQERLRTDGGPCIQNILTPIEEKIKGMISLSVEGQPPIWDSDSEITSFPVIPELSPTEVEGMPSTLVQESPSLSEDNIKEELELEEIKIIPDDARTPCTSPRPEQNTTLSTSQDWTSWTPQNLRKRKSSALEDGQSKQSRNKAVHEAYILLAETRAELAKEKHAKEIELLNLQIKKEKLQIELLQMKKQRF